MVIIPLLLSVSVHVFFIAILGLSLQFEPNPVQASFVEPVQAVLMDQELIARETRQERKRSEEAKRQAEEKRKKEADAKRQADLKRRQEVERKRKLEEKKAKEADAKRQAEEKRKKEAEEQFTRDKQSAYSALAELVGEIQSKVHQNWTYAGDATGLETIISVKVTQGGEVTAAKVVQSSGDEIFDRSAENAVLKASPLPFPANSTYYEFIKEFNFKFSPDG